MAGHHKVRKSLNLWHLSMKWVVSRSRWKWAVMDKTRRRGKSEITLDKKKGRALWVVAISYPVAWSKCLISEVPPDLKYFLYFIWAGTPFWIDYRISRHALRQWQIGRLCVIAQELESQLWAAKFLQPAEIEEGGQRLWVGSRGPGVLP